MPPTSEQQACIDAHVTGDNLTISAGAGTGKTTTLKGMAAATPNKTGLYAAFNKAVATEASRSFPRNIECKTIHSLAFAWARQRWGIGPLMDRLKGGRVPPQQVARILGSNERIEAETGVYLAPQQVARIAMETVTRFCHSGDDEVQPWHLPKVNRVDSREGRRELAKAVVPMARKAWAEIDRPDGQLRYTHDAYLKAFCMSRPSLPYDFVLLDEAQDSNGVTVELIRGQGAQVVTVGDSAQAIYGWRGATDCMDAFDAVHHRQLSQSFRFGQAVADEANKWLDLLDADLRLSGNPAKDSVLAPAEHAEAVLCRSNAEAVSTVIRCHNPVDGQGNRLPAVPVAIVGGGQDVIRFARAAGELKERGFTSHPDLFPFENWAQVQDYMSEAHDGQDLAVMVNLVDDYGPDGVIDAIERCVPEGRAKVTVSTAHKAKGREWSSVRVANDFNEPKQDPETGERKDPSPDESMLAYVTVTRAMDVLDRSGLSWVDRHLLGLPSSGLPAEPAPVFATGGPVPPVGPLRVEGAVSVCGVGHGDERDLTCHREPGHPGLHTTDTRAWRTPVPAS